MSKELSCDNCDTPTHLLYDYETGEEVCGNCGTIVAEQSKSEIFSEFGFTDRSLDSYYQGYGHSSASDKVVTSVMKSSRVMLDYSTLGVNSSKIDTRNLDFKGQRLNNSAELYRLRAMNKYTVNKEPNKIRNIKNAFHTIRVLTDKLGLPDAVAERAAKIYKQAWQAKIVKGRSINGMAAAALYYACKESSISRNLTTIVSLIPRHDTDREERKKIFYYYNILIKTLNLDTPPIVDPFAEIGRIAYKAQVSQKSIRKAIELGDKLRLFDQTIFYGKSPIAVAVCLLYVATKYTEEDVKQKVMNDASDISTVTIRKRCFEYVTLLKKMNEYIPESLMSMMTRDENNEVKISA